MDGNVERGKGVCERRGNGGGLGLGIANREREEK